jgi:tRNA(fMet)-specific endonuclease VapC
VVTLAIDSSILIAVMRHQNPGVVSAFMSLDLSHNSVVVPVVVLHELWSGAALAANPVGERQKIDRVLTDLEIVPLEAADIEQTATVRAALRQRGHVIGDMDILIAGQALARGWTVVTHNVRHFGRVDGLPLIDWAVGVEPLSPAEIAARVAKLPNPT